MYEYNKSYTLHLIPHKDDVM